MWIALVAGASWGADPAPALELAGLVRHADDVTVFVRADGALTWQGEALMDYDLAPLLKAAVAANPSTRVVVSADPGAPHDQVMNAIDLARQAGAARVALESRGFDDPVQEAADPLFDPGAAESLDAAPLSRAEERALRPKHHRFPQNPYGNTNSYSAYTLEPGETKVGLGSVSVGLAKGVQLGTAPLLDLVGVFNANGKIDFVRKGGLDVAVLGQVYTVPLTRLLTAVGADGLLSGANGTSVTTRASYVAVGGTGSLRLARPWTLHTQLYWAAPSARGDIAFDDLPEVLVPGLELGGSAAVGLGVRADLAVLNLATDVRFNRRDSVFAWLRYPFYGRVRGLTDGSVEGFEGIDGLSFAVEYASPIRLSDSYSLAIGYQASYRHFEARLGIGWSAVPGTWLLQAFEVSWRFGGATRRAEHEIRKGYRESGGGPDDSP